MLQNATARHSHQTPNSKCYTIQHKNATQMNTFTLSILTVLLTEFRDWLYMFFSCSEAASEAASAAGKPPGDKG